MEAGIGPVVVATDEKAIVDAVEKAGGIAVMTRADHPSGSDRIYEAVEIFDPEGRHDVIVNVQGDLPTIDPRAIAASLPPLADKDVDITTIAVEITRADERTNPNVVKPVMTPIGENRFRASTSPAPRPRRAMGRSITTLASTPIGGRHWRALLRCRPRRSRNVNVSNSSARSKTGCAST
jgi:CMP-2-keto-3-deoxyoctulosonic acid synthetase